MSKKPSVSFFCPAYNDEKNLPVLIPKVFSILAKSCSNFEIIIIDDASHDKTGVAADKLAKKYSPFITVVHHKQNMDYGGALLSGLTHANKYGYIFYTDGDNQYDVLELKKMLRYVNRYDAVIGYRTNRSVTRKRKMQSAIYNTLIRLLFRLKVRDINCAIRIIKRSVIKKIHLSSKSAFLPAEMLIELRKQGAKIKEIPVTHYRRLYGKASGGNPKVILHTLSDLLIYFLFSYRK